VPLPRPEPCPPPLLLQRPIDSGAGQASREARAPLATSQSTASVWRDKHLVTPINAFSDVDQKHPKESAQRTARTRLSGKETAGETGREHLVVRDGVVQRGVTERVRLVHVRRQVGVDAKLPKLGQLVAHQAPLRLLDELGEDLCVACPPEIERSRRKQNVRAGNSGERVDARSGAATEDGSIRRRAPSRAGAGADGRRHPWRRRRRGRSRPGTGRRSLGFPGARCGCDSTREL